MPLANGDELATWLASLPREWTAGCGAEIFARGREAYDAPPRPYHNWRHVEACVAELRPFPCDHPRSVFLALVFHDAVYVAGRTDNESNSAELARVVLDECVSQPEIEAIDRMIRATSNHHAHAASADRDLAVMLDIDLSILGASRDAYARYAQAIRDEFVPSATTDTRFRIGRIEFLEGMLASPRLFITDEGSRRWDAPARSNIAWEIDGLRREQGLVERAASALRRR